MHRYCLTCEQDKPTFTCRQCGMRCCRACLVEQDGELVCRERCYDPHKQADELASRQREYLELESDWFHVWRTK